MSDALGLLPAHNNDAVEVDSFATALRRTVLAAEHLHRERRQVLGATLLDKSVEITAEILLMLAWQVHCFKAHDTRAGHRVERSDGIDESPEFNGALVETEALRS